MNRKDLQNLSRARVREAKALLAGNHFAGSYYLMGYSVECAIKAAIAKRTQRFDFADKRVATNSYSHDLKALLKVAGLWPALEADMRVAKALEDNWATVKDWNVATRYSLSTTEPRARDFYSACTAPTHGILPWLKNYW